MLVLDYFSYYVLDCWFLIEWRMKFNILSSGCMMCFIFYDICLSIDIVQGNNSVDVKTKRNIEEAEDDLINKIYTGDSLSSITHELSNIINQTPVNDRSAPNKAMTKDGFDNYSIYKVIKFPKDAVKIVILTPNNDTQDECDIKQHLVGQRRNIKSNGNSENIKLLSKDKNKIIEQKKNINHNDAFLIDKDLNQTIISRGGVQDLEKNKILNMDTNKLFNIPNEVKGYIISKKPSSTNDDVNLLFEERKETHDNSSTENNSNENNEKSNEISDLETSSDTKNHYTEIVNTTKANIKIDINYNNSDTSDEDIKIVIQRRKNGKQNCIYDEQLLLDLLRSSLNCRNHWGLQDTNTLNEKCSNFNSLPNIHRPIYYESSKLASNDNGKYYLYNLPNNGRRV